MSDYLYIHVPFCLKKCRYCDFYSQEKTGAIPDYVSSLVKEIKLKAENPGNTDGAEVQTIYFGGGTPSLLPPASIGTVLDTIRNTYTVSSDAEITLEANPGTLDKDYLRQIYSLGINRLSIGVQSFDQDRLVLLGRIHTANQAVRAIETARLAGFDNIGLDLIYGLPGESKAVWRAQMDRAISLGPTHLSCYMLTLEPGTPLYQEYEKGHFIPMDADGQVELFDFTSVYLEEAGFTHYEISNFSRGQLWESRHNSAYWNMVPYTGFGPSAHSYGIQLGPDGKKQYVRSWNLPDVGSYIIALAGGNTPAGGQETISPDQQMLERIMVGLRTRQGMDIKGLSEQYDASFRKSFFDLVEQLENEGLGYLSRKKENFTLTLAGWMRLDNIVEIFTGILPL